MNTSSKLIEIKRGIFTERIHNGYICVVDSGGNIVFKQGDFNDKLFLLRSAQKPFQAFSIISSGAFLKFNLTQKHLAVCCSSHTGSDEHTAIVSDILNKAEIDKSMLKCGTHQPLDKETEYNLIRNNLRPSPIHNNCSGKHAGMLAVCKAKDWDLETYLEPDHPLQRQIFDLTKDFCLQKDALPFAFDGCNAPVVGMPLPSIGIGFLNLFLSAEGNLLLQSCLEYPFLLGGQNRLDTSIIKAAKGNLFAKVGAEGLCIIVNPSKKQSLIVKIEDGNDFARAIVCIDLLRKLEWINFEEYNILNILFPKKIITRSGKETGDVVTFLD
jgi:L-asparaginase II